MAKESVIAIILGLVLGVAVALVAVFYTVGTQKDANTKSAQDASAASASSKLDTISIPPTVTVLRSLEIISPQSGSIVESKTLTIKGTAGVGTLLIIQSPVKTQVTQTDRDSYSLDFPLALGENVITLSAYHAGSVIPVQKKLYVYRLNP